MLSQLKSKNLYCELELPKEMYIYPVFYILLLELVDPRTPKMKKLPKTLPGDEYEIEKILSHIRINITLLKGKIVGTRKILWNYR